MFVAQVPQPEPASRLRSAARDFSFLRSDSRCRRYVTVLSNVTPRYLGSEKDRVSFLKLTFISGLLLDSSTFIRCEVLVSQKSF